MIDIECTMQIHYPNEKSNLTDGDIIQSLSPISCFRNLDDNHIIMILHPYNDWNDENKNYDYAYYEIILNNKFVKTYSFQNIITMIQHRDIFQRFKKQTESEIDSKFLDIKNEMLEELFQKYIIMKGL